MNGASHKVQKGPGNPMAMYWEDMKTGSAFDHRHHILIGRSVWNRGNTFKMITSMISCCIHNCPWLLNSIMSDHLGGVNDATWRRCFTTRLVNVRSPREIGFEGGNLDYEWIPPHHIFSFREQQHGDRICEWICVFPCMCTWKPDNSNSGPRAWDLI